MNWDEHISYHAFCWRFCAGNKATLFENNPVQMNDDNICIIMYSKDYLSILHWSSNTSVYYCSARIIAWQNSRNLISAYASDYDKRSHLDTFANPSEIKWEIILLAR